MDAQKLQSPMCSKTIFKVIPKSEAVRTDVPNKFVDEVSFFTSFIPFTTIQNIINLQMNYITIK